MHLFTFSEIVEKLAVELDFDIPEERWFCLPSSEGVSVMPQLLNSDLHREWKVASLFFAKNRNDVFNEHVLSCDSNQGHAAYAGVTDLR